MRTRRRTTAILAGFFAAGLLIGAAAQLAKVSADASAARTVAVNGADPVVA
ncbi:hypothetical protein [Streptomyces sp. NPDC012756]|uniref:hypothetical protein n=1 Tax=Streptomyces sp. NPDC012756 TaxID=3364847 RepID=UPI0036CE7E7D